MGSLNKMEPQVLLTDKLLRIFLSFKSWTLTWWSWNKQEMSSWNGWNLQISHRCPSGRIRMLTSQIHSQGLTEKLMGPCFLDKVAIPKVQYIYVYIYILIYIYPKNLKPVDKWSSSHRHTLLTAMDHRFAWTTTPDLWCWPWEVNLSRNQWGFGCRYDDDDGIDLHWIAG